MRIVFSGEPWGSPAQILTQAQITKLLAKHKVLRGTVHRITSSSIVLQIQQLEIELPLTLISPDATKLLHEALQIELTQLEAGRFALKLLPPTIKQELQPEVIISQELSSVLTELNIPATAETIAVAQELLRQGFALQKDLIWTLLPWAEQGQLDEAFQLLQAKFPLVPDLIKLVAGLKGRDLHEPLYPEVRGKLPNELEAVFAVPSWEGRSQWSGKFSEGELFKALVRLLVEERFIEAMLRQQDNTAVVFALPFLLNDELYASWIRINRDDSSQSHHNSDENGHGRFHIQLTIPTRHLGLVGAELWLRSEQVKIIMMVEENPKVLQKYASSLQQELYDLGWTVTQIEVGGWDSAQSSSFTL